MAEKCGCDYHPNVSSRWQHCRDCATPVSETFRVSRRGLCIDCGVERSLDNMLQQHEGAGPLHRLAVQRQLEVAQATLAGVVVHPGRQKPLTAVPSDPSLPC